MPHNEEDRAPYECDDSLLVRHVFAKPCNRENPHEFDTFCIPSTRRRMYASAQMSCLRWLAVTAPRTFAAAHLPVENFSQTAAILYVHNRSAAQI
jgi:hypothetical protein